MKDNIDKTDWPIKHHCYGNSIKVQPYAATTTTTTIVTATTGI